MSVYYDSGPFKIYQWNKLIDDINEQGQNPPGTCPKADKLDEVTDPHLWSVSDIKKAQAVLKHICPENTFEETIDKWKTGIIDKLETALGKGWCGDCSGGGGGWGPCINHQQSRSVPYYAGYENIRVIITSRLDGSVLSDMTYRIPQFGVIGYYNTQAGVAAQIDLLAQAYGTTTDTIYLHIEVDPQGIVYSSINFTETRAC